MKKYILLMLQLLLALTLQTICMAQDKVRSDTSEYAQFYFAESDHDFGDVIQGEVVEYIFDFDNKGNSPLLIQNVLITCGCTAPEWPRNPIQPGDSGQIKIVFNSVSKIGRQNKVITVRSNAKDGDYRLRISAMVLPAKKED